MMWWVIWYSMMVGLARLVLQERVSFRDESAVCSCGYPMAGLPSATPCPECGGDPAARTRAVWTFDFNMVIRMLVMGVVYWFLLKYGIMLCTIAYWKWQAGWDWGAIETQMGRHGNWSQPLRVLAIALAIASNMLPRGKTGWLLATLLWVLVLLGLFVQIVLRKQVPMTWFSTGELWPVVAWSSGLTGGLTGLWAAFVWRREWTKKNSGPQVGPAEKSTD